MLTANDVNGEYVNGTMGTIIDISKERGDAICIQVLTDKGKKVDVYRYEREIERQDIEEREEKDENGKTVIVKKIVRKIVGSFKQFPIKIAWAMSIRGKPLDRLTLIRVAGIQDSFMWQFQEQSL